MTATATTTEPAKSPVTTRTVDTAPHSDRALAEWWRGTIVFAGRNLQHIRQIPEKLLDVTIQPLMFVLLFAYVFGGAIAVQNGNYREFLIGGILIQSLAFAMMGPATAIATDQQEGVIDRFRSLPVPRSSYLSGHFLAELGGIGMSIVILLGTGLVVGWRTHNDVLHVAGALVLLVLFAAAIVWIGTLIGLLVRSPDAVMGIGFTLVFPLTFISNAFVPIDTMPSVLRTIAEWNPISALVAAVRDLFGNDAGQLAPHTWPLQHAVLFAFVSCGIILLLAVPATLHRYRVRTTD
jgi:ABC transporter DrrB family efflux protein